MMTNNNIPQGYKLSPLGVIPQDWEVRRLGEIANKIGSGVTPKGGAAVYKHSGNYFIRSQNIGWGCLLLDDVAFIDNATHLKQISTELNIDDVLLNITGASIGRCAIATEQICGGNVNQHVCIIRLNNKYSIPNYINSCLLSDYGQRIIDSYQAGGNRQGLNFEQIKSFAIALPPLAEQERIAEVLRTWDVAIEKQGALVNALTRRKRALMQQILTARKRLPNFSAPWQTVKLGDILKESKEIEKSPNPYNRITVKLNLNGIVKREVKREECVDATVQYKRYTGQFVYGKQNLHKGAFGIIPNELDGCESSQDIPSFDFSSNVDPIFFLNFLGRDSIYEALENISTGTGSKRIQPKDLFKVRYKFPPFEEQKAISQILTTADREIELATTKLNSLRTQKRALMQQLLTGKKRLKI